LLLIHSSEELVLVRWAGKWDKVVSHTLLVNGTRLALVCLDFSGLRVLCLLVAPEGTFVHGSLHSSGNGVAVD